MGKLVNKKDLGEIIGVSQTTLTTWQKQGMPIEVASGRGKAQLYDTEKVIKWKIDREINRIVSGASDEILDYTQERARLTKHQANIEEMKELEQKGELIPAGDVVLFGSGMVAAARSKLLAVHSKIKSRFPQVQQSVIDEIESIHHEALDELGDDGLPPEIRRRLSVSSDDLDVAAEPDDQRVG